MYLFFVNTGSWSGRYLSSTNSFIYSLYNSGGYGYFKNDVWPYYQYSTYSYYSYGPTFGGGHDIYISDGAGYNSYSYFNCHSYTRPVCDNTGWIPGNTNNFKPSELEVYYEVHS